MGRRSDTLKFLWYAQAIKIIKKMLKSKRIVCMITLIVIVNVVNIPLIGAYIDPYFEDYDIGPSYEWKKLYGEGRIFNIWELSDTFIGIGYLSSGGKNEINILYFDKMGKLLNNSLVYIKTHSNAIADVKMINKKYFILAGHYMDYNYGNYDYYGYMALINLNGTIILEKTYQYESIYFYKGNEQHWKGNTEFDCVEYMPGDGYILGGITTTYDVNTKKRSSHAYIIKLNEYGIKEWDNIYNATRTEVIKKISGGGYLCGNIDNNALIRINETGHVMWINEDYYKIYDIKILDNNEYIIVGGLDNFLLRARARYYGKKELAHECVSRIDAGGNPIWSSIPIFGLSGYLHLWQIYPTNDKGFLVFGTTTSFRDNGWDIIVIKLDEKGSFLWYSIYDMSPLSSTLYLGHESFILSGSLNYKACLIKVGNILELSTNLNIPYFYQYDTKWCGPSSLSMVLKSYGEDTYNWIISDDLQLSKSDGVTLGPGDVYKNLYDYVKNLYPEYNPELKKYSSIENIFDDIKYNIDKGYPLILALKNLFMPVDKNKHIVTVIGYDDMGLFIHDPSGVLSDWEVTEGFEKINVYVKWDDFKDLIFLGDFLKEHTGTLLVLKGQTSTILGTIDIGCSLNNPETSSILFRNKDDFSDFLYLDTENGLTWSDGERKVTSDDLFSVKIGVNNHRPTEESYQLEFLIKNDEGVEESFQKIVNSANYSRVESFFESIKLSEYVEKSGIYQINIRLLDTENKLIDEFSTPSFQYEYVEIQEPELEPEPESGPEPQSQPRGIPGFPFESIIMGIILTFVILWCARAWIASPQLGHAIVRMRII